MGDDYYGPDSPEGRVTMFAGKGGVGKTTCAAATALHYASLEEETLIISTDPTPSLAHIFEINDEQKPARVRQDLDLAELGLGEVLSRIIEVTHETPANKVFDMLVYDPAPRARIGIYRSERIPDLYPVDTAADGVPD